MTQREIRLVDDCPERSARQQAGDHEFDALLRVLSQRAIRRSRMFPNRIHKLVAWSTPIRHRCQSAPKRGSPALLVLIVRSRVGPQLGREPRDVDQQSLPAGLHVDELKLDADHLLIKARSTAGEPVCPSCGQASARVHSSYRRTPQDLPWQGLAVTWCLRVRRFRCQHCPGRIFAERVPRLGGTKDGRTLLRKACSRFGIYRS